MKKYNSKDLYKFTPLRKIHGEILIEEIKEKLPFILINGKKAGKTMLITAGIHGGEYTSIKAVQELEKKIIPENLIGTIILLPLVNSSSFKRRQAFLTPVDYKNLNRCFPGNPEGTFSEKLAFFLTQEFICKCDYYLDCHGGDLPEKLLPHVYYSTLYTDKKKEDTAFKMADRINVPFKINSTSVGGAYQAAVEYGIPSLLLERGNFGEIKKKNVAFYIEDLLNVLRYLQFFDEKAIKYSVNSVKKIQYVYSTQNSCWDTYVIAGQSVQQGELIGEQVNIFGKVLKQFFAEKAGKVLYYIASYSVVKGELLYAIIDESA